MDLREDKTLSLRVFLSFPNVYVRVTIHDLLLNCCLISETLSCRDHRSHSLIIFLLSVWILDAWKE
jgi:hypothetical protein